MTKKISGFVDVPAEDLPAFVEALPLHSKLTNAEPGCHYFRVMPDPNLEGRFRVEEAFDDEAAYAAHVERMHKTEWVEVTRNITRSYPAPS